MYCSELVYVIYKEQLGVQLCQLHRVSSYRTKGLQKIMRKRHISPDQYVEAPSDLL